MAAVEFEAKLVDGKIEVPATVQSRFTGSVGVILFDGDERTLESWPVQNRRRWELIMKQARSSLTALESAELVVLHNEADTQLDRVGKRSMPDIERMYAELEQD